MDCVLGIDIGTSSVKSLVLQINGKILGETSKSYTVISPQSGWREQNPADWWQAVVETVASVLKKNGIRPSRVKAIGLSGQMHGSVFLDDRGKVIRPAILWNDQRTEVECKELTGRAGGPEALIQAVNNPALQGYTAPKILWLRNHEPENFAKLRQILLPKDYIRFLMTGDYATDVSDASGTLLLDVFKRKWSSDLLTKLDLNPEILPRLYESPDVVGQLTVKASRTLGLDAGVRVVAGAGDQAAGAVGMGVISSGLVSATIGTSGVVFAHSDEAVPNAYGLLQSFCHAVPGKWSVFGCMLSAGGALEWYRHAMFPKKSHATLLKWAQSVREPDPGLFFAPYLDGERCPYPDRQVRAAWVGLSTTHSRKDLVRALIEGITFGMTDQLQLLRGLKVPICEIRLGGGGSKSRFWRQLQADIYGSPVARIETPSVSALGAAILAGTGGKFWPSVQKGCETAVQTKKAIEPNPRSQEFYSDRYRRYRALYPMLAEMALRA